ncbi:glycosyltransferase, partial [Candidatus Berkelbacteria bacterium]|nr:glycosyltransferase [Candidatus Berkelbacteria bacterium]
MRILMVTEVYHPTTNGVVKSIDTFRDELERRGHEVHIIRPARPGAPRQKNVHNLRSWPLPTNRDYRWTIASQGEFTDLVAKLKPDVIHSHHTFIVGGMAIKAGRILGIPVVQTYHTLMTEYVHHIPPIGWFEALGWTWIARPLDWIAQQVMIWRSRTFLNRVDHIIVPSPSIQKLLIDYGVKRPITPIPTGIDLEDFKEMASDEELRAQGIDPAKPFIVFIGRIGKEKNIQVVCETFAWLREKDGQTDLQLVLIGDGPERGWVER